MEQYPLLEEAKRMRRRVYATVNLKAYRSIGSLVAYLSLLGAAILESKVL